MMARKGGEYVRPIVVGPGRGLAFRADPLPLGLARAGRPARSAAGEALQRETDLLVVLADDYARMFDYAKAAETREKILPFLDKGTGRSERAAFISIIDLWKAMASAPPQTVEIPGDTEIAMTDAGEVPVEISGLEVPLLPDTGSAFNMIVRPGGQGPAGPDPAHGRDERRLRRQLQPRPHDRPPGADAQLRCDEDIVALRRKGAMLKTY